MQVNAGFFSLLMIKIKKEVHEHFQKKYSINQHVTKNQLHKGEHHTMTPDNYTIALAAISSAGFALMLEPISKLLAAAIRSLFHTITKGKTKL